MELCRTAEEKAEETEDVLLTQAPSSATQLFLDTIFIRYSLIIMANLTAAYNRGDKCQRHHKAARRRWHLPEGGINRLFCKTSICG